MWNANLPTARKMARKLDQRIGDKGCSISEIVTIFIDDPAQMNKSQILEIMLRLETPTALKNTIKEKLTRPDDTIFDSIETILKEWKQRTSKRATMHTLIEHLRSCYLNNIADTLEDKFLPLKNSSDGILSLNNNNIFSKVALQPVTALAKEENDNFQHLNVVRSYAEHPLVEQQSNHVSIGITDTQIDSSLCNGIASTQIDPLIFGSSPVNGRPTSVISKHSTRMVTPDRRFYVLTILITLALSILVFLMYQNFAEQLSNINASFKREQKIVSNLYNATNYNTTLEDSGKIWHDDVIDSQKGLEQPVVLSSRNEEAILIKNYNELDKFFNSQTNWKNAVNIEFDNTLGLICPKVGTSNFPFKVPPNFKRFLPKLTQLVLKSPITCEYLFDVILKYFTENQFVGFNFVGEIDGDSSQQINQFLHRNIRSLEDVNITGVVQSSTQIIEIRKDAVLNFVKNFSLNLEYASHERINRNIISDRFCSIFPKVDRLEIKGISVKPDDLTKLQNCSNLESLTAFIKVGGDDLTQIEQINWKDKFRFLNFLGLKLQFEVCPAFKFFETFFNNADQLPKYKVSSNCFMSHKHELSRRKSKPG